MSPKPARTRSPLPEGFGPVEVCGDVICADGLSLHRVGVCSLSSEGETITGSAAGLLAGQEERARFELFERVATLTAMAEHRGTHRLLSLRGQVVGSIDGAALFPQSPEPSRYRYARSNGVALHRSFRAAALRARWELAERDRVLRAWCGQIRPAPISMGGFSGSASYDWQAHGFGRAPFAPEADVVGVFGFPRRQEDPLAMGFAARPGAPAALDAALGEALQSFAFLWGEPLPSSAPVLGPTPLHHLEHFQYPPHHERLRRWLSGEHVQGPSPPQGVPSKVRFVSLTPAWLPGQLAVVKAVCADALPLAFGDVPLLTGHQPHPIA